MSFNKLLFKIYWTTNKTIYLWYSLFKVIICILGLHNNCYSHMYNITIEYFLAKCTIIGKHRMHNIKKKYKN